MKRSDLFGLIMILTILIIRVSILVVPEVDMKIFDIVIHHFLIGIILVLIGILIPKQKDYLKIFIYAIGIGLIIDQAVFMILGAGMDKEYWALPSLIGTGVLAGIVFFFRNKIAR